MRKLFFTATALVAFSGLGNANTGVVVQRNCAAMFNFTYVYAYNQGFSEAESNAIAFAVYDKCLGCDGL